MSRPKVLQELSSHLAGVLRAGLRAGPSAGQDAEAPFPIYWGHPRDLDDHPELAAVSPLVGLCVLHVRPDSRMRPAGPIIEGGEPAAADRPQEPRCHRPPLWIACRYLLSMRSDDPLEEQEIVAAALQALHDRPIVPRAALESLAAAEGVLQGVGGFALELVDDADLWRALGLRRHRVLVAFDVTVPVLSSAQEPAPRVARRDLRVVDLEAAAAARDGRFDVPRPAGKAVS